MRDLLDPPRRPPEACVVPPPEEPSEQELNTARGDEALVDQRAGLAAEGDAVEEIATEAVGRALGGGPVGREAAREVCSLPDRFDRTLHRGPGTAAFIEDSGAVTDRIDAIVTRDGESRSDHDVAVVGEGKAERRRRGVGAHTGGPYYDVERYADAALQHHLLGAHRRDPAGNQDLYAESA